MRYYLITPVEISPHHDPGCTFIRWGARYILNLFDPDAIIMPLSDANKDPAAWDTMRHQKSILCLSAIPHYFISDVKCFWDWTIWDLAAAALNAGHTVIDLAGYSKLNLPPTDHQTATSSLLAHPRTHRTLNVQKRFAIIITRDLLSCHVASTINPASYHLPCTAFFAKQYAHTPPGAKYYNVVTLRRIDSSPWTTTRLAEIAQQHMSDLPVRYICHTLRDYDYCRPHLPTLADCHLVYDPATLLNIYSHTSRLLSLRLHASIPAISLGAQVCNIALDTRSAALTDLGVPCQTLAHLARDPFIPYFHPQPLHHHIDHQAYIQLLNKHLSRN